MVGKCRVCVEGFGQLRQRRKSRWLKWVVEESQGQHATSSHHGAQRVQQPSARTLTVVEEVKVQGILVFRWFVFLIVLRQRLYRRRKLGMVAIKGHFLRTEG